MTRLALRLALADGRARLRVALVATGVALALLVALGGLAAIAAGLRMADREERLVAPLGQAPTGTTRYAAPAAPFARWAPQPGPGGSPVLDLAGRRLRVVEVAASGPDAPVPPALPRLPAPGEAFASPALAAFLTSPAGAPFRPRVPERIVGLVPARLVPTPDALVLLRGVAMPAIEPGIVQVERSDGGGSYGGSVDAVDLVTSFAPAAGVHGLPVDTSFSAGNVIASGALLALLLELPPLLLVAAAARIGGRERERRLAGLRLAGASAGHLRRVALVEALLAAALGLAGAAAVALGALALAGPTPSALGVSVWREDVVPPGWQLAGAVALVLAIAAATALAAARRAAAPASERPLAPRRARGRVDVAVGLAIAAVVLGVLVVPRSAVAALPILIVLALVGGLALLTRLPGRALVRSGRPAALLAGTRLSADPVALGRPSAALAVALLVGGMLAVVSTGDGGAGRARALPVGAAALTSTGVDPARPDWWSPLAAELPADALASVAVLHRAEGGLAVVDRCEELRPALGAAAEAACRRGRVVDERLPDDLTRDPAVPLGGRVALPDILGASLVARATLPAGAVGAEVAAVLVTARDQAGLEALRAVVERRADPAGPSPQIAATDRTAPLRPDAEPWAVRGLLLLAVVALLGAVSAAVLALDGVADRRRALAALAALGVPPRVLVRSLALEIAAPAVTIGLGALGIGVALGWGLASGEPTHPDPALLAELAAVPFAAATLAWLLALPVLQKALADTRSLART